MEGGGRDRLPRDRLAERRSRAPRGLPGADPAGALTDIPSRAATFRRRCGMKAGMKRSPVRRFSVVAFAVLFLLASGCTATPVDGSHPGPSGSDRSSPTEPGTPRARIGITPRGAKADPSGGISVTVKHGTLASVTVKADGEPVDGHFGDGQESWATSWALTTDTRY